ncbi:MAG: rhomboid family intramembrane serine protease [Bacteroidales bacterium]|nr:rhomboid family intramembrane serine protease [Bacteroidales bacterium]
MANDSKRLKYSIIFPLFFLVVIWLIEIFEVELNLDFSFLGIYPLKVKGLIGILTAPLIHASFNHLISNSAPFFILGVALFYFYPKIAHKVFIFIYLTTNFWVWVSARSAYHIGASGIVYGLASFIFFSGIIKKNTRLTAISLLTIFLYGSMVWGIFPFKQTISFESHLFGAIAGLVMAIYYKNYDVQIIKSKKSSNDNLNINCTDSISQIKYFYTEEDED